MTNIIKKYLYYVVLAIILVLGVYIRTKLYISSNVFEDDECRLALGMMNKSIWQMFLPLGAYSSSPIFVFISKIIAECSNYNEHALKLISFIASLLSIGLLYKICTTYFNRKISTIITLFLFVINNQNIYFSSIFKTYSVEVFISLLCLYYFPKINIANLDYKKLFIFSTICIFLMLFSLPSLFFIGTLFLVNIYHNYKDKQLYKNLLLIIIPFITIFGLYFFFNLLPTKTMQMEEFSEFWHGVFSAGVIQTIAVTIKFLFEPNRYILCIVMLLAISTFYIILEKKEHNDFNIYLLSTVYLSLFASCIHLYPIALGRTALFLLPVILLLIIKPLDSIKLNNKSLYILYCMFIIGFYSYLTPSYLTHTNNVLATFRNFAPKSLMQEIIKDYNPETDEFVSTQSSYYSFAFYAIKYQFFPAWHILLNKKNTNDNAKEIYYDYYNNLDKNKKYWFYLIKEYPLSPQQAPTLEWLKHQNVLYSKQELGSYLYYISGIKEVKP